ncbi:hypothetical protein DEO72_LG10g2836 [Vigna unguiculata]|uniref:Uncharacterized protein n=1 Tax=Vigna unguiculata TaxID=3917 RepID=A0A4D6NCP0_VIGUN|nr:hypothetical protein DEO72_LG10g2836 [Vigna unguiculata]
MLEPETATTANLKHTLTGTTDQRDQNSESTKNCGRTERKIGKIKKIIIKDTREGWVQREIPEINEDRVDDQNGGARSKFGLLLHHGVATAHSVRPKLSPVMPPATGGPAGADADLSPLQDQQRVRSRNLLLHRLKLPSCITCHHNTRDLSAVETWKKLKGAKKDR